MVKLVTHAQSEHFQVHTIGATEKREDGMDWTADWLGQTDTRKQVIRIKLCAHRRQK